MLLRLMKTSGLAEVEISAGKRGHAALLDWLQPQPLSGPGAPAGGEARPLSRETPPSPRPL